LIMNFVSADLMARLIFNFFKKMDVLSVLVSLRRRSIILTSMSSRSILAAIQKSQIANCDTVAVMEVPCSLLYHLLPRRRELERCATRCATFA
ncbi:hypothetical protein ALC57_00492, partial [Trachymyrmex cornetzi]